MFQIFGYVKEYVSGLNKIHFLTVSLLISFLIFINYHFGIEHRIQQVSILSIRTILLYILFCFTFWLAYFIIFGKKLFRFRSTSFYVLLILSPLVFAVKMSVTTLPSFLSGHLYFPSFSYWTIVLVWPLKLLITALSVWLLWKLCRLPSPVAGLEKGRARIAPYFILLLLMIPLIAMAARNPGFQQVYPKIKLIDFIEKMVSNPLPYRAFFELSYGSDFFTIELFFRGFLVLAFAHFAGEKAILPMAAFYCTIHFGKPLPECISSYFGGLILGAIVNRTGSIWGGLLIHLGIAWMMEIAGVIAG